MNRDRILRSILDRALVPFGSTSDDWIHDPERMARCADAAEDGADGSTHAEVIADYRDTLRSAIPSRCERLRAEAEAYCDGIEAWHEANGSLWSEVG